jgi:RNA polymerase sigma-70 factor, ECF subfamily
VSLALGGSQPSFQEIVRRYERPVYNLICRIVHDPALAEDVAQDAFLKAFRSLAAFDSNRRFSSWIFRIANNAAVDALRRRRVDPIAHSDTADPPPAPAAEPVELAALAEALGAALDALRPDWRAAIVLRYHEGRSYEEIAEILDIPEGTAKTFVHRARKQMADTLTSAGWRPQQPDEQPEGTQR